MRVSLIVASLLCAACAAGARRPTSPSPTSRAVRLARPHARLLVIQSPKVTAGKIVYFAESPVDATLDQARALLRGAGWTETKSERFVNDDKFTGAGRSSPRARTTAASRVTEGSGMQQVDITVARLNAPR